MNEEGSVVKRSLQAKFVGRSNGGIVNPVSRPKWGIDYTKRKWHVRGFSRILCETTSILLGVRT